jgi:hypothetical protein
MSPTVEQEVVRQRRYWSIANHALMTALGRKRTLRIGRKSDVPNFDFESMFATWSLPNVRIGVDFRRWTSAGKRT